MISTVGKRQRIMFLGGKVIS